ncbi:nucleolar protein 16 [Trichomonascus vanleenenianus]|uniref:Nop16p n=1 Tax=Trichomonascus vanleenenianus TaxID=2268995 RepID=UPI003ECABF69
MPSGVRRKRANKSSISKTSRRVKQKQKKIRIAHNPIIAQHWDPKLTLQQNYKKLGLRAKLGRPAGGNEKEISLNAVKEEKRKSEKKLQAGEGRIIRDEEGNVVRIEYGKAKEHDDSDAEEEEEWTGFEEETTEVVKQLEEAAKHALIKPRVQSEGEQDWISRLVEKHGDDYEAMFWDKKLNVYQQSQGDLKRRVKKWKKQNGIE